MRVRTTHSMEILTLNKLQSAALYIQFTFDQTEMEIVIVRTLLRILITQCRHVEKIM